MVCKIWISNSMVRLSYFANEIYEVIYNIQLSLADDFKSFNYLSFLCQIIFAELYFNTIHKYHFLYRSKKLRIRKWDPHSVAKVN